MQLRKVTADQIQPLLHDFHRKSGHFELIPEGSILIGIYDKEVLVGYFVVLMANDTTAAIIQGYLKPEARHRRYPKLAMLLLEQGMKKEGIKTVKLMTYNRFSSYLKFADGLGYKPESIVFKKEI